VLDLNKTNPIDCTCSLTGNAVSPVANHIPFFNQVTVHAHFFGGGEGAGNRSSMQPYTLLLASWLAVLGLTVIRNQLTISVGY